MRLSGLSTAAILLLTSTLFAQHTASAPAPSPAPSTPVTAPAPAPPAPSPAPSAASSASSSASMSHASAPAPSPVSSPVSHVSSSPSPVASHESVSSSPSNASATKAASPEHGTQSVARRVDENSSQKDHEAKAFDPDLRRRICDDGVCKEKEKEPPAHPAPESDLRRRVCVGGECPCGPGEPAGKNGCVAPAVQARAQQCEVGATWNGTRCEKSTEDCASIRARAGALAEELRSIKAEMQAACTNDPSGSECENARQRMEDVRQLYRRLINGASAPCRAGLPDEISLI